MIAGRGWTRPVVRRARTLGLIVAATAAPTLSAQATAEQLAWLKTHAVHVETVRAGNGFADLEPLRDLIGSARIVGLGEGTHGTREHFQAKHRLLEFLVEELGFSIFSIEANMPEAAALNDYVLGGDGDVARLIGGLHFWTWNTEAVRDMVEWMRASNAEWKAQRSRRRLQFTGFDMQSGAMALQHATDFLAKHDPDHARAIAPNLAKLGSYRPYAARPGFGCATGQFPIEAARGRRIRFTGWVKTRSLRQGRACLWWRVDGPTPSLDNMTGRGQTGTSDWRQLVIDTTVPDDAEAISFGLLMSGTGTGWFDGLTVEVDGKPWSAAAFDLDFESDEPRGIVHADPFGGAPDAGYRCVVDGRVARTGQRSLRFERIPPDPDELTSTRALTITKQLLEHMVSSRDAYADATDPRAADWAIQNARLLHQWAGLGTGTPGHRDASMASNVAWILEQNPAARVVLWAHNAHVSDDFPLQGAHLRRRFGADYVNLAFCSSHGEYTAKGDHGDRAAFPLAEPPANSFEAILEADGRDLLLVDLRTAEATDPGAAWLTESRPFGGNIGALQMDEHYFPTTLHGKFDLLFYVRNTTPTRPLSSRQK